MADYLSRACRLQLTTAMENLIRTAVYEISQIFEDSLHDHQVELARKGEEIAYLKIKLQRAELRLKEVSIGSEPELSLSQSFESPKVSEEPASPPAAPHQSSFAPVEGFEFEVPDDWCVPLESENVNKPENPCPSVRLKQFSIPLCPIPLKHEAFSRLDMSMLRRRRSKDSSRTESREETKPKRRPGRPPVERHGQVKGVLMNIKEEPFDVDVETIRRRPGRPKGPGFRKVESTNMKDTQGSASKFIFMCRFCPKEFDTAFGLRVHDRAHKKCKGCKRIFPYPSVLGQHKEKCKYYRKLMELSSVSPKEVISKDKSSKTKQKVSGKKMNLFTCKACQKPFSTRSSLVGHPCFTSCQICHLKLYRAALAGHMAKVHDRHRGFAAGNIDTSWKKPFVKMEESEKRDFTPFKRAKANIKQCSEGFKCVICRKVFVKKHYAIEHTFQHTGEKPFKCAMCSRGFTSRNALSVHRRKHHGVVLRKVMKCTCSQRFFDKSKYKAHKLICPKAGK